MRIFIKIIVAAIFLNLISCTKNTIGPDPNNSTVTDIDGNTYKALKIGNQIWSIENLRTTKYKDGTAISLVKSDSVWLSIFDSKHEAYCYYNNTSDADSIKRFGALYNWYAVNTKKLAPEGWHVPTDSDWTSLNDFLTSNGQNYYDSIGFSANAGGHRYYNGEFYEIGHCGRWWSTTERGVQQAYCRLLCTDANDLSDFTDKSAGCLIRLIKD
jgi:uncharacterized protein (TIGR02145 family)